MPIQVGWSSVGAISVPECARVQEYGQEAILKLEKAVVLKPKKHDALWCLGNALTTRALLNPDLEEAKCDFDTAIEYFKIALAEEPGNPTYQKSLEVSAKVRLWDSESRCCLGVGIDHMGSVGAIAFSKKQSNVVNSNKRKGRDAEDLECQSEVKTFSARLYFRTQPKKWQRK